MKYKKKLFTAINVTPVVCSNLSVIYELITSMRYTFILLLLSGTCYEVTWYYSMQFHTTIFTSLLPDYCY